MIFYLAIVLLAMPVIVFFHLVFSCGGAAGFNLLVTTDQNLLHQQNVRGRKIGVLVGTKVKLKI